MKNFLFACGAIGALLLTSCGGKEEAKKEESATPAATTPAAAVNEADAATITGKVAFSGAKPPMATIDMSANPACARAHSTPQKSEQVTVNENGTLRYTFVWVKAGVPDRQWPVPSSPVELDQEGCMYKPHVIGVMASQG